MIAELQNTNKSRSSLRSKHLAQLEENKATLNEIKSIATQKLISNGATDQDFPNNEEGILRGNLLILCHYTKYNGYIFIFKSSCK